MEADVQPTGAWLAHGCHDFGAREETRARGERNGLQFLKTWHAAQDAMPKQPDCKWAQRPDRILFTVNVPNVTAEKADITVIGAAFALAERDTDTLALAAISSATRVGLRGPLPAENSRTEQDSRCHGIGCSPAGFNNPNTCHRAAKRLLLGFSAVWLTCLHV
jgi:hypothetical protein